MSMTWWGFASRTGLLPGALQPLPVPAVSYHGVPALPQLRAIFPQHHAIHGRLGSSHAFCKTKKDIDMAYFVTAHELAHQWWAHQLIGGQVQGSNMMSETLANIRLYRWPQQKYGKDEMRKSCRH